MSSNDKVLIRVGSTPVRINLKIQLSDKGVQRSTKETKKREALEKATARRRQFIIGEITLSYNLFIIERDDGCDGTSFRCPVLC